MVLHQLQRARLPGLDRVVGGFEGEHEQREAAVIDAVCGAFRGVDQAQVRRVQSRLRDRANSVGAGHEVIEGDGCAGPEPRPVLDAHPGLGDHAERALGADHQTVGARPGAGPGQTPALEHARRGHHAQAFDEVVDVGVERREMAARAGRDPAAQRRVLKALRKMPERETVRLQGGLEGRAEDAALDARGAAGAVDLQDLIEPLEIEADRAGEAVAHVRIDAADHARAAAERDHRGAGGAGPVEQRDRRQPRSWVWQPYPERL